MRTARAEIDIDRPIDAVFDYMLDPVRAPAWRALVTRLVPVDDAPMRTGSRAMLHFETGGEVRVQEITLSACERPVRQRWQNTSDGFQLDVEFTLASQGTRTRVTVTADTTGTRLSTRLLVPFVTRAHRERFRDTLVRLKRGIESTTFEHA